MTPDEFKAKWSSKIPQLGGSAGAPKQGEEPAKPSGGSAGAVAARQAKTTQAKAAVAPSQADSAQAPLPKELSATVKPTPTMSPGSFVGPPPEAAPPLPINVGNIATNLANETLVGQGTRTLVNGARQVGQSIGEGLAAVPGQAKTLKDKLYERAMAEARRLSATPQ